MSHVAEINFLCQNLDALGDAAKELGMELKLGQKTYRWYGTSVGDYPLPSGMEVKDLGKCDHAICIPGNLQAYEIGVRKNQDESYNLVWDFWGGGFGLEAKVGPEAVKLKDEYLAAVTVRNMRKHGRQVQRSVNAQGQIVIRGR